MQSCFGFKFNESFRQLSNVNNELFGQLSNSQNKRDVEKRRAAVALVTSSADSSAVHPNVEYRSLAFESCLR